VGASRGEHREGDAKNAAGGNFEYRKSFDIGWETARLVAMIKNGQIFSSDLRCRGANGQASIFSRAKKSGRSCRSQWKLTIITLVPDERACHPLR
jgi:hypothetical protein